MILAPHISVRQYGSIFVRKKAVRFLRRTALGCYAANDAVLLHVRLPLRHIYRSITAHRSGNPAVTGNINCPVVGKGKPALNRQSLTVCDA